MEQVRRALVTGAASGIGAAVAARLRSDRLEVVTLDLAQADVTVDVSDEDAVMRLSDEIGPIDVLVNSAGIKGPTGQLVATTSAEWRQVFEVNVLGTVNTLRAFLPAMTDRAWGRVVNIASMAGKEGNPHVSVYSASKAAVIGLTKSVGKELATTGVLVNSVAPAIIATPMTATDDAEVLARAAAAVPMGRSGRPEEVAELVSFLCSERLSFSTGAVYDISGGRATY